MNLVKSNSKKKFLVAFTVLFTLALSLTAFATDYTTAYSTTYNGQTAVRYELRIDSSRKLVQINYGGTRSWRNNNPGNLRYGSFSSTNGAIGSDYGSFSIFPDYQTGYAAMKTLINTTYYNHTIESMMYIYAPPEENDTVGYINYLVNTTGMSRNTYIRNMSSTQLNSLLNAIISHEGFTAGSTTSFVE